MTIIYPIDTESDMTETPRTDAFKKRFERDCLASSAAGDIQKSLFEAGKFIDDIADSHEQLERDLAAANERATTAEAEAAAMREDAMRYRWLTQQAILVERKDRMQHVWELPFLVMSGDYPYIRNESISAAIDAALTKESSHDCR